MSETTAKEVQVVDKPLVMLPGGKRRFFIAILYLMFCFDLFIRYGFSYVMPLIQDDLSLSNTQVGLMSSAIFLGMAIFVYPISFMGENHSQRRAISFCGILWSGATVVCGMAGGAVTLILSRLCVGAGSSAYAPLSTAMITSWFKKSQWGSALGLYNTAMIVGGALGTVIFAALGEALGWRACFYVIGGISLVICLLSFLLPDNKKLMASRACRLATMKQMKWRRSSSTWSIRRSCCFLIRRCWRCVWLPGWRCSPSIPVRPSRRSISRMLRA